jgi:hypothetical protein
MSKEETQTYGYTDDNQEIAPGLQFGLNAGVAYLTKFEFNPNGGKDGAAQECLDIIFTVNGKEISYRKFPVTKAFDAQGNEVNDPKHPKMIEALRDFNSIITHILHAYVEKDAIKTAMQVPIKSFKQFCDIAKSILPKGFETEKMDIFAQWQWQITGDNNKTYLRLPQNMKQGKWLCKSIEPVEVWTEIHNPTNKTKALFYKDGAGNVHPFTRTQWFMESNFAKQQVEEDTIPTGEGFKESETSETSETWTEEES